MTGVLRRKSLAQEHVTQVGPTACALDLRPHSVRIGQPTDRPRDLLVETRPATVGIELVIRSVKGCVASSAGIHPRGMVVFVLARERRLRSLANDDTLLGTR